MKLSCDTPIVSLPFSGTHHGISPEPPSLQLLGTHLPVSLALFGKCLLVELQPRSLPRILTAHMRPASRPPFSRVFSEWGLGGHRENLCITREATEFCESSGHRPACVPVSALPLHSQPRLSTSLDSYIQFPHLQDGGVAYFAAGL